jgi:hypothetical protein
VHDTTWFEVERIPAVFVASSEFADAAEVQAHSLGLPDVCRVIVPHPIQDATDDEMRAKADAAVDALLRSLTR